MARIPSQSGSSDARFTAGAEGRLPGATRPGSFASWRKTAGISMRKDMSDIIRNYESLIKSLESATPTILWSAIQPVYNKSQIYVPKKTGALASSAQLIAGTDERGRPMVTLTYGDSTAPYAAIVHEFVHLNHEYPTRAKYLQGALEEEKDAFLTSVAVDYMAIMV